MFIIVVLFITLANLRAIKNFLENFVLENCGYIQKNIVLIFTQGRFFLTFFAVYKMIDSEYSMDIYKSVKISIRTVMKNPEML